MRKAGLDGRLLSAAEFVRAESVLADVGTDHGYLPVFLLTEGRVSRAVLSDINEGPLSSAEENVRSAGLSHLCEFRLTDGCRELYGLGITDYAICGMGGELIADIIEHAPHLKDENVRLILQPMTKQAHLRTYLSQAGFTTLGESYSEQGGKYYVCICSEYRGKASELTCAEAELGIPPRDPGQVSFYVGYLSAKLASYRRALEGKRSGGEPCDRELEVVSAIEQKLKEYEKQTGEKQ